MEALPITRPFFARRWYPLEQSKAAMKRFAIRGRMALHYIWKLPGLREGRWPCENEKIGQPICLTLRIGLAWNAEA
jgi:hypothetical protein